MRRARIALLTIAVLGAMIAQVPGSAQEPNEEDPLLPQAAQGLTVPVGFVSRVFAVPPIVPTTLEWGPDTTGGARHGSFLYVGGVSGNPISCDGCGQVVAISDEGDLHVAAEGLNSVLGVTFGPDNSMWVADNLNSRGRVSRLTDTDADGVFETSSVVLKNIPNGRHQTNGLTFGPDGMLYVANGNATDNGLACGPPLGPADPVGLPEPLKSFYEDTFRNTECADPEIEPWTGSIIRVDPAWEDVDLMTDVRVDEDPFYAEDGMDDETVLVAEGFRNIYDVAFRPAKPNEIWTPMNGSDDPSSSEPIFGLEVDNEQIVGFTQPPEGEEPQPIFGPIIEDGGFPSCLYDPHENPFPEPTIGHDHDGIPEPQQNDYPGVEERFGPCSADTVIRPRTVLERGHEGTSGLAFEDGDNFPARYDGDLFIAEWGSLWNLNGVPLSGTSGASPTGHKVVQLEINEDGSVEGNEREFTTGGLPIDVTFGENGFLYVADMTSGIHEIQHVEGLETDEVVRVDMREGQFVPQSTTIIRGQTVCWTNLDEEPHNVTGERAVKLVDQLAGEQILQSGSELSSPGDLAQNEEHCFRFAVPGVYVYHSTTTATDRDTMRGTINVTTLER